VKYEKGTKVYKVDHRGNLQTLILDDIVYKVKKGAILGKKYLNEKELEEAFKSGEISLTTTEFEKKKIEQYKKQIEELQNKIKQLEG